MTEVEMAPVHENIKASGPPEPWILRFADLIPGTGAVLDLAAGAGRNGRLFLARGRAVTFIDRNTAALVDLASGPGGAEIIEADLETDPPPFGPGGALAGRSFAAVVCVNYLHRPLLADLSADLPADLLTGLPGALAPGGVLLYSTFMVGNEKFGRPSNPDYLLRPGELLQHAKTHNMRVIAFEEGPVTRKDGAQSVRQSIAAARADG
ncbi:MAG: class I SAM-dependent methyltransferase [Rhodospirillales bacterium]